MTTNAIIVGSGEADRRPRPGRTAGELAVESARAALDDAGLKISDIDGILTGYTVAESHLDFSCHVAQELGVRPKLSATISRSGATGASLVASAAMALTSGACDTVLALWADNRVSAPEVDIVASFASQSTAYELPYGPLVATQYALIAQRYMAKYGLTPEEMASVAVAFRDHASRNPHARFRQPITIADVLSSTLISSPLHKLECTLVTDFGGAVIMTRKERARDFVKPLELLGFGLLDHARQHPLRARVVRRRRDRHSGRWGPCLPDGANSGRATSRWRSSTTASRSPCCSNWKASASANPGRLAPRWRVGCSGATALCLRTQTAACCRARTAAFCMSPKRWRRCAARRANGSWIAGPPLYWCTATAAYSPYTRP